MLEMRAKIAEVNGRIAEAHAKNREANLRIKEADKELAGLNSINAPPERLPPARYRYCNLLNSLIFHSLR
jgi:hypothetical protein